MPPLPDLPSPSAGRAPSPAAPAPSPIASSRGLSTLSSDLQFDGNVSGAGDLQVDGAIKGDVRVGRLIVGETGAIEGAVTAEYLEVRGRVVGAVAGKQVKLVSTAYVDGDITAEQLSIDIGAYFQGRVLQSRRDTPAPVASAPRPASVETATPAPTTANAAAAPQTIEMKTL
ncbi:cell shape determination protein CcmA [Brevundimonas sp. AAP58]|nr:cell shape determination protein CcmA [Brevundimonas sp. AAP58]